MIESTGTTHRTELHNLLEHYGAMVAMYHGNGRLVDDGSPEMPCTFQIGQTSTGRVFILCDFVPPIPLPLMFGVPLRNANFVGTTNDGRLVRVEGHIHQVNFLPIVPDDRDEWLWAAFSAREATVESGTGAQVATLRYGLTNFTVLGTTYLQRSDSSQERVLPLELQSSAMTVHVVLKPLSDYDKIAARLQLLKTPEVTCEAEFSVHSQDDLDLVSGMIDSLVYLLSIARGTKVNWIYCDSYDANGELIRRRHSDRITKPYVSLPTIDAIAEGGLATKRFIESCFPVYEERRMAYLLNDGTIDAYIDARIETDFLQMRAAKQVIALEMLKAVFLDQPDCPAAEFIIPREQFEGMIPQLQSSLLSALQGAATGGPAITNANRRAICSPDHLRGLDRRSFRHILAKLFRVIGLQLGAREFDLLIASRNSLVHNGRFYCEDATERETSELPPLASKVTEYSFLVRTIDRVFLRLVGYDGRYTAHYFEANRYFARQESV